MNRPQDDVEKLRGEIKDISDHQEVQIALQPLITNGGKNSKDSEKEIESSKWTNLLILSGFATTIGTAVPAGYAIGALNSPAEHMRNWSNQSFIERYNIFLSFNAIDILWSFVVSIFLIGGTIGALSGAWAANKFGRKTSIFLCDLLFIIAAVCFFTCRFLNSVEMLLIGRFIVGLAAGLTVACLPMYLSEIAPLSLRGTLGVFCAVGTTAGVVVAQIFTLGSIFGSEAKWHIALSFYVLLNLVCFIPYKYFPESPKWLYVIKGNVKSAEKELNRLRSFDEKQRIQCELQAMEIELKEPDQTTGLVEVLKDPKFLLPMMLVCAFHGGQQLSGINVIFNYSVSIFRKAGLSPKLSEWANLGAGSLNLTISLCGPYLMAKFNRRPLMLFSTFFCFFALLAFAVMLHFIETVTWFAFGCIACIFVHIFFYQFGIGPIPYFIGAELFEVAPRSVAMSMGSLCNFMGSFITCVTFPSLANACGAMVFLPFAFTCALIFFLTFFYLPETRGRDPAETARIISKGFKSKVRNK